MMLMVRQSCWISSKSLEVAIHNHPVVADSIHCGTRLNNNMLQGSQEYSLEKYSNRQKPTIAAKTAASLCTHHGNYLNLRPVVCVCHMYETIHGLDHCRIWKLHTTGILQCHHFVPRITIVQGDRKFERSSGEGVVGKHHSSILHLYSINTFRFQVRRCK